MKSEEPKKKEPEDPKVREERIAKRTDEILKKVREIPNAEQDIREYYQAQDRWYEGKECGTYPDALEIWSRHLSKIIEEIPDYLEKLEKSKNPKQGKGLEYVLNKNRQHRAILDGMEESYLHIMKELEPYSVLVDAWKKATDYEQWQGYAFFTGKKGYFLKMYPIIQKYIEIHKITPENLPASPDDYSESEIKAMSESVELFERELFEELLTEANKKDLEDTVDLEKLTIESQIEKLTRADLTEEERKPVRSGKRFSITTGPLSMGRLKTDKFQASFDPATGHYIASEVIPVGGLGYKTKNKDDYDLLIWGEQRGTLGKPFHYTPYHKAILESFSSIVAEGMAGGRDPRTILIPGKQILRNIGGGDEDQISKESEEMVFKLIWEMTYTPYRVEWKLQHNEEKYPALSNIKDARVHGHFMNVQIIMVDGHYQYIPNYERPFPHYENNVPMEKDVLGWLPTPFIFEQIQGLIYTHLSELLNTTDLSELNVRDWYGKRVLTIMNKGYVRFLKPYILGKLKYLEKTQNPKNEQSMGHYLAFKTLADEMFLKNTGTGWEGLTKKKRDNFKNNVWKILNVLKERGCFDTVEKCTTPGKGKEITKVRIWNIHLPKPNDVITGTKKGRKKGKVAAPEDDGKECPKLV